MNFQEYIVNKNASILEAMNAINKNQKSVVFICDGKKLCGVLSDGDIRRHILGQGDLNSKAGDIANRTPKYLLQNSGVNIAEYMNSQGVSALPIVNAQKEIVAIRFAGNESVYEHEELNVPVVIMAGGKGTRLQPFTNVLPKPLIPIGNKTITERIMDAFIKFGCTDFNMVVNYKSGLIKTYFAELAEYNVSFTDEKEFLGTAGGLQLLKGKVNGTFFMTNCDILIDDDYYDILQYHKSQGAIATMVCALQNYEIPYGTVQLDEQGSVKYLEEKPQNSFLINTGMYVIEPEFLEHIPKDTFIHMTDVIAECIAAGEKVGAYPVSENAWMDMGKMSELEKMTARLI